MKIISVGFNFLYKLFFVRDKLKGVRSPKSGVRSPEPEVRSQKTELFLLPTSVSRFAGFRRGVYTALAGLLNFRLLTSDFLV